MRLRCKYKWLGTFLVLVIGFFILFEAGCAPTLRQPAGPLDPGQEIVTLKTRPGVTMRILVAKPKGEPKGTFIYFPGGEGQLVGRSGRVGGWVARHGGSFADQGFTAVVVDRPSDQWELSDEFKTTKEYTEDIKKVIEFVNQKWRKPIFLLGHSRGTISVAHFGATLKDDRIKGIVLAGSDGGRRRVSLATLPLENITYPTLFVHHANDGCFEIQAVREQRKRLTNSPRVGFVEVVGGDSGSDPCRGGNNLHTFLGREKEVIKAITDWAGGKPVPARIGSQ